MTPVLFVVPLAVTPLKAQETPPEEPPPVITGFDPKSGPPGTEVTLTGENLAGATSVRFNSLEAQFRGGFEGSTLVATVPAGATLGPITVVAPGGSYTTEISFVVTAVDPPEITRFSPESGHAGVAVSIEGLNLSRATSVRFNGVEAEFTIFGNTITAYVPAAASTGPITVVTPGGASTSGASFIVESQAGAPVITSMTPSSGKPGATVILGGNNLDSATSVRFNGVEAEFSVLGVSVLATVPPAASTGPITLQTPTGVATSPGVFMVIDPQAPVITGFIPNGGEPGTKVSITGTNLLRVTEVRLGGATADFTAVSETELRVTVPAAATTGSFTVTSNAGTAVSSEVFYVLARILSFEPKHGPVGTRVTIQGVNFSGTIAVQFGGANAEFTNSSPTELQATVPEGAVSGVISIATPAGFARTDSNFLLPPRITAVLPPSAEPGTMVTIMGENLLETTAVEFGGTQAAFSPATLTSITTTVPESALSGPITVTTPAGSAVSPDLFYVGSFSDLAVSLTAFPDSVSVGDFLSYTLRVSNRGPLEAPGVLFQDQLPAGVQLIFPPSGADCMEVNNLITCQLGNLPAGGELTIRISVAITGGPYLTNQVTVSSSGADPNLADNTASLLTILKGAPPPPALTNVVLSAAFQVNTIALSWPAEAEGFALESAASLTQPVAWLAVTETPVVSGGTKTVTIPASAGPSFFRLRKP